MLPREVHWSDKGKGNRGKGGKGKGDKRYESHKGKWGDAAENKQTGQNGGISNKQRLYHLEHDQAENLANAESLRNDLHDLSGKVAMRNTIRQTNQRY